MTEDKSSKKPDEGSLGRAEGTPGPFPLTQADQERLGQLFHQLIEAIAAARKDYAEGKQVALVSEAECVNLRTQLEKMLGELKRGDTP